MGEDKIKVISNQFFSNLFTSFHPSNEDILKITKKNCLFLSGDSKEMLNLPFSRDEIKKSVFDLGKLKVWVLMASM